MGGRFGSYSVAGFNHNRWPVWVGIRIYQGLPVVSPVQLYLDLKGYKGRGEEAAQFILGQVLEKTWSQDKTTSNEK
jgi:hypothetical protein